MVAGGGGERTQAARWGTCRDGARCFRCLKCRNGGHYVKENTGKEEVEVTDCQCCGERISATELRDLIR